MATVPNIRLLQNAGTTYTGTTFNLTVPSTTAGSGLYLGICNNTNSTINFVSSISGGGTWQKVTSLAQGATAGELWYVENATGSVTTVTVNLGSSITGACSYAEFSGILASSSFDSAVSTSTASASWSLSPGNTSVVTQEVELCIDFDYQLNGGKGGSSATPAGFTQANTVVISASSHTYLNYKIRTGAVSTETVTITGSSASSSSVLVILSVFKAVSGVIQQRGVVSGAGTAITITTPRPGNTLTLSVNNASGGASTVTETGASWTKQTTASNTNAVTELWILNNTSGSENTTITLGNACAYVFCEWYGLSTSSVVDQSVTSNASMAVGTTTAMTTGTTGTTAFATELTLGTLGGNANGKGATWSSILNGYFNLGNTASGGKSVQTVYKILTATGTTSTGATLSPTLATDGYATSLVTFKQTGQGSTFIPRRTLIGVGV